MKDQRAFIFYFLMSIIFWDFGNQLRKISYDSYFDNFKNPLFSVIHVNNTGSAFGMFQNSTLMLIVVSIIAVALITIYVYKNVSFKDKIELFSLTVFMGGTLGNLFERINNGHVVDYIKLNFIDFPVFNAFDIMICLGVFLYVVFVLFDFKSLKEQTHDNN